MNTVQKYFQVSPEDMAYVKFIVESYEGLAVLRTLNANQGIMEWMIPPDLLTEAEKLIESLRGEVTILSLPPPRNTDSPSPVQRKRW